MTKHIHVAAACNAPYALALATMLASLSSNLERSRLVNVYILQRDVGANLRKKIEHAVDPKLVTLYWIDVDDKMLAPLARTIRKFDTISIESYYRLLLPEILPDDLDKVIYLDCDLVVTRDLGELWDMDVQGTYLLASPELVPDSQFVSSPRGIRRYKDLQLPGDLKLFNAGVMVINLRHWRENNLFLRALIYVFETGEDLRWHDQEALNAVLAGEWRELDPSWNVTMHVFRRKVDPSSVADLVKDPCIIHYNSAIKPWDPDFSLGFRDIYFHYLDMTAWSGWRPDTPRPLWKRAFVTIRRAAQKRQFSLKRSVREVSSRVSTWRSIHRPLVQIDEGAIPRNAQHEIRAFIYADSPGPRLNGALNHLWQLGIDRAFVLLGRGCRRDAAVLRKMYGNLHVFRDKHHAQRPLDIVQRNLLNRFGEGYWCVMLNTYERLHYPYEREISLKELCQSFDELGFDSLFCQVVELSSSKAKNGPSVDEGGSRSYLFSIDVGRFDSVARDLYTNRIFPGSVLVAMAQSRSGNEICYRSKVALFKFHQGIHLANDLKTIGRAQMADCQGAILRCNEEIDIMSKMSLSGATKPLRFTGIKQLVEMNVLRPGQALDTLRRTSASFRLKN